jgi:hypothetical protein
VAGHSRQDELEEGSRLGDLGFLRARFESDTNDLRDSRAATDVGNDVLAISAAL